MYLSISYSTISFHVRNNIRDASLINAIKTSKSYNAQTCKVFVVKLPSASNFRWPYSYHRWIIDFTRSSIVRVAHSLDCI